jgi:hypothetical protein
MKRSVQQPCNVAFGSQRALLMPTLFALELGPGLPGRNFHAIDDATFSAFGFHARVALFYREGFFFHRLAHHAFQIGSIRLF